MLIVSWLARLSKSVPAVSASMGRPASDNFAADLLQSANSQAGINPNEAQHLRNAAQAWLSVVR
jgi:hypothetical protein